MAQRNQSTATREQMLVVGALATSIPVTKTADFTVSDTDTFIISDRGATNTVTLPAAATCPGRILVIKTIQAFTVVSASSDVIPRIGGSAGTAILAGTDGVWAVLVSNGTAWENMASN
jgi:hypothetical protein